MLRSAAVPPRGRDGWGVVIGYCWRGGGSGRGNC